MFFWMGAIVIRDDTTKQTEWREALYKRTGSFSSRLELHVGKKDFTQAALQAKHDDLDYATTQPPLARCLCPWLAAL
jgi:hypothetical protein